MHRGLPSPSRASEARRRGGTPAAGAQGPVWEGGTWRVRVVVQGAPRLPGARRRHSRVFADAFAGRADEGRVRP